MDFRAFVSSWMTYFWVHCIVFVEADDIESNVSGAEAATEQANRQLAKAATSQKSGTTIVSPPPFQYTKMCIWATYFHYKPISTNVKWALSKVNLILPVHFFNLLNTVVLLKIRVETQSLFALGCKYILRSLIINITWVHFCSLPWKKDNGLTKLLNP